MRGVSNKHCLLTFFINLSFADVVPDQCLKTFWYLDAIPERLSFKNINSHKSVNDKNHAKLLCMQRVQKECAGSSGETAGLEVINLFPCSTEIIRLINVKMPTIVGILTFFSVINTSCVA